MANLRGLARRRQRRRRLLRRHVQMRKIDNRVYYDWPNTIKIIRESQLNARHLQRRRARLPLVWY